jgi:alpha-N-arabinofuranosidase
VANVILQLLAAHITTQTLPATADFDPLFYVAGKNEDTGAYIFKGAVYNSTDGADVPVSLAFDGLTAGTEADLTILTGPEDPYGYNDPFTGVNVVTTAQEKVVANGDGVFEFSLPNLSVAVLDTGASTAVTRSMKRGRRV